MINILLVEDHNLVRNGIKMLLESDDNFQVVDEADNAEDALSLLATKPIDLIITDINLKAMDGLELTSKVKAQYPSVKVIVLSMLNDIAHVSSSLDRGAQAYIIKSSDYCELLFAIPYVMEGGTYVCEAIVQDLIKQGKEFHSSNDKHYRSIEELDVSDREMEILSLIGDGYTNNDIANKLFLSKRTVEGHRQNLIDKTNVKNSAQLIKYAVKNGLI